MRAFALITLYLFVFTIPWQNTLSLESWGTISEAVGIVALVAGILSCIVAGRFRTPSTTLLLMVAFVGHALLSAAWSPDPSTTLVKSATLFQLVAMVWLITELANQDSQVQGIVLAYVLGSVVSVVATFVQFAAGEANPDLRYAAAGFNPNDQALALALALPMAWFVAAHSRGLWIELLSIAYVVAAPVAIVLTGSRTGALACCTAFAVSFVSIRRGSLRSKLLVVVALCLCVVFLIQYAPDTSWARLSTIGEQIDSGDLNLRTTIWAGGLAEFLQHPLLGVGEGAYLQVSTHYLGENFVAHNTFISVLVELGLVGFVLFVSILGRTAGAIWSISAPTRSLWFAVFATWCIGVLAATWETQKATWLLFALVMVSARTEFSEVESTDEKRACAA